LVYRRCAQWPLECQHQTASKAGLQDYTTRQGGML